MQNLKNPHPIIVSLHAKERYVQRIDNKVDIEDVYDTLITDKVIKIILTIKNGIIPLSKCNLIVKNYTVITVVPATKLRSTSATLRKLRPGYRSISISKEGE